MSQEGVDPVIQQLRWLQEVSNLRSEFACALFIQFVDLRNRYPHKLGKILYELPVRIGELVNVEIPSKHLDCSNAPCGIALASLPRTDARAPL